MTVKIPTPIEQMTTDGYITQPWYQYFNDADKENQVVNLDTTVGVVLNDRYTVITTTTTVQHILDRPEPGSRALIVLQIGATQGNAVTIAAATDVAIGPGGENALTYLTSVSTYDLIELAGASTLQYYIINQTTGVSVTASS